MKVGFIGAGRTSAAVGGFLKLKGFSLMGYYSRTFASARENAFITSSKAYPEIPQLIEDCELLFISTPDDEIYHTACSMAVWRGGYEGKIVGTLSGAHSSDILKPLFLKGASVVSFHPPYTFPDKKVDPHELEGITFAVEGRGCYYSDFKRALMDCGIRYVQLEPEYKALYHAAACVAANYTVALAAAAMDLLRCTGVKKEMFSHLAAAAVKNAYLAEDPAQALTGPIARGDVQTVLKHITAIKEYAPQLMPLYKALGVYSADLAQGIDPGVRERIKEVLLNEEG